MGVKKITSSCSEKKKPPRTAKSGRLLIYQIVLIALHVNHAPDTCSDTNRSITVNADYSVGSEGKRLSGRVTSSGIWKPSMFNALMIFLMISKRNSTSTCMFICAPPLAFIPLKRTEISSFKMQKYMSVKGLFALLK